MSTENVVASWLTAGHRLAEFHSTMLLNANGPHPHMHEGRHFWRNSLLKSAGPEGTIGSV
jgi:hypothetical protein